MSLKKRITDIEKKEKAMANIVWERIEQEKNYLQAPELTRARVPGGWLVRFKNSDTGGPTFVPDPKHEWK
jgi:hypothetical protein